MDPALSQCFGKADAPFSFDEPAIINAQTGFPNQERRCRGRCGSCGPSARADCAMDGSGWGL
jgi:hypothetical protein